MGHKIIHGCSLHIQDENSKVVKEKSELSPRMRKVKQYTSFIPKKPKCKTLKSRKLKIEIIDPKTIYIIKKKIKNKYN